MISCTFQRALHVLRHEEMQIQIGARKICGYIVWCIPGLSTHQQEQFDMFVLDIETRGVQILNSSSTDNWSWSTASFAGRFAMTSLNIVSR